MPSAIKKFFKKLTMSDEEYRKWLSHEKGKEFESYILNNFFPNNYFELLEMTHDYETNKKHFVKSSLKPDFKFLDKKTNKIFYVECKYRNKLYQDKFHWAKSNEQFNRYKDIELNEKTETFIAMGLGGTASNPDKIYLMPLSKIKYPALYPSVLRNWEVNNVYDVFKIINS